MVINPPADKKMKKRTFHLIGLAIFLMALLINLPGVKFGFPLLTHNDEPSILQHVVNMTESGSFVNTNYHKPHQTSTHFFYGYLNLVSHLARGKNIAQVNEQEPTFMYLHARIVMCVIGALISLLAWKIGNLLKGPSLGFFFALLCLLYPSYIMNARYVTPDITITMFTFLTVFLALKYLKTNRIMWLALASISSGLCVMEKYPGLLTASVVIIALVLRYVLDKETPTSQKVKPFFRDAIFMLICFLLVLLVLGHNLYMNLDKVINGLKNESRSYHPGHDGLTFFGNLKYYIKEFLGQTNPLIWASAFLGFFVLIKRKNTLAIVFFVGVIYWFALSTLGLHWERWSLPMMIAPLFLSACGLAFVYDQVKEHKPDKVFYIVLLMLGVGLYAINSFSEGLRWVWPDTRWLSLQYLNEEGIKEEECVYEGYTPFYPQKWKHFHDLDRETILDGKKYIIMSDHMHSRFFDEPERFADIIDYYEFLRSKSTLIKVFTPDRNYQTLSQKVGKIWSYIQWALNGFSQTDITTGPIIEIYRINP